MNQAVNTAVTGVAPGRGRKPTVLKGGKTLK